MKRNQGVTLVELVVCVALLGLVVGFVVNLLPTGTLGLQRASDVSAATAYGVEVVDNATQNPLNPYQQSLVDIDRTVQVGPTDFHVTRTWYPAEGGTMYDVVVTMQGPRGTPVTVGTRVAAASAP
jgi:prepilin-type N-terminal cleavage/methylation domain-containing protein